MNLIDSCLDLVLPARVGPRPRTRMALPHMQLDQWPPAEIARQLVELALSIPGIRAKQSRMAFPTSLALCLEDDFAHGPAGPFWACGGAGCCAPSEEAAPVSPAARAAPAFKNPRRVFDMMTTSQVTKSGLNRLISYIRRVWRLNITSIGFPQSSKLMIAGSGVMRCPQPEDGVV